MDPFANIYVYVCTVIPPNANNGSNGSNGSIAWAGFPKKPLRTDTLSQ